MGRGTGKRHETNDPAANSAAAELTELRLVGGPKFRKSVHLGLVRTLDGDGGNVAVAATDGCCGGRQRDRSQLLQPAPGGAAAATAVPARAKLACVQSPSEGRCTEFIFHINSFKNRYATCSL